MNLTLDPKKMQMTETMEVGEGDEVREDSADTFSFFTPDGLVRRDSELKVSALKSCIRRFVIMEKAPTRDSG